MGHYYFRTTRGQGLGEGAGPSRRCALQTPSSRSLFGVCVLLRLGVFEDAGRRALEGEDGVPFAEVVHVWCVIELGEGSTWDAVAVSTRSGTVTFLFTD